MEKKQLDYFHGWYDAYAAGFYGDDEFVNANIKLKDDHSRRVCSEMDYLAGELNLAANQRRLAEVIALFHDIGRFEQFARYRTYRDSASVNHGVFGVEILREQNVLDGVDKAEKEIIERAIEYHNMKVLPDGLDGELLLFSQLIRDADKLDIYYIIAEYYKEYEQNPDSFRLEIELPDKPEYTQAVLERVLKGERIDYRQLQTWNDMKLCELSWVYDVNFVPALERIKKFRFLEMIVDFLPETDDIKRAKDKVFSYVEMRISRGY